jgi:hypothetical protein
MLAVLGANGPLLSFASTSLICSSAARHCGHSPQPRNLASSGLTVCGLSDHLPVDRAVFSISPEGSPNGARQNLTLADKEILTRYLTSLRN